MESSAPRAERGTLAGGVWANEARAGFKEKNMRMKKQREVVGGGGVAAFSGEGGGEGEEYGLPRGDASGISPGSKAFHDSGTPSSTGALGTISVHPEVELAIRVLFELGCHSSSYMD